MGQALPHVPQLAVSVMTLVHFWPQAVSVGSVQRHLVSFPFAVATVVQALSVGQTRLQEPQLPLSISRSTQWLLQVTMPGAHETGASGGKAASIAG